MVTKRSAPIPDQVLLDAVNQTLHAFPDKCADRWGEAEKSHCRTLCGDEYEHVETDWIGRRAINFRKAGKCVSVAGGAKRKALETPKDQYAAYLQSEHWVEFRQYVLDWWKHRCCLCSGKATEVHHNTYDRIGAEDFIDCVPLCRTCHMRVHGRMPSGNEAFDKKGSSGVLFQHNSDTVVRCNGDG